MKIAFKIPPVINNYSDLHLLAEAGKENISFIIFSKNPFTIEGYYSYNFEKQISAADYAATVKKIIDQDEVLNQQFASIHIFYNFHTSTLVPEKYFIDEEKNAVCNLLFGQDKTGTCFHENVKGQHIKLVYRVPDKLYETLNAAYPKNNFAHSTSNQLHNALNEETSLQCIIYHNSIKLLLFKNDAIQIVQYADYETPADVCYHLLNVCERFQISTAEVNLVLSGMIEKNSSLFTEIYKYFLHVSFPIVSTEVHISDALKEIPTHFYHHLTAQVLCV